MISSSVVFFVISFISLPFISTPISAQTPQNCKDCLSSAINSQDPACATIPHFFEINWQENHTNNNSAPLTKEQRKCICVLAKLTNDTWTRGCIAKPPAACTDQGNVTIALFNILETYRGNNECKSDGVERNGQVHSMISLASWVHIGAASIVAIALSFLVFAI